MQTLDENIVQLYIRVEERMVWGKGVYNEVGGGGEKTIPLYSPHNLWVTWWLLPPLLMLCAEGMEASLLAGFSMGCAHEQRTWHSLWVLTICYHHALLGFKKEQGFMVMYSRADTIVNNVSYWQFAIYIWNISVKWYFSWGNHYFSNKFIYNVIQYYQKLKPKKNKSVFRLESTAFFWNFRM